MVVPSPKRRKARRAGKQNSAYRLAATLKNEESGIRNQQGQESGTELGESSEESPGPAVIQCEHDHSTRPCGSRPRRCGCDRHHRTSATGTAKPGCAAAAP